MKFKSPVLSLLLIFLCFISAHGQYFSPAVPFLNIYPDARGRSLGQTGTATLPDIYSQNYNPAKYAFFNSKKNLLSDWNYQYLQKQDTCDKANGIPGFKENNSFNLENPDFDCIDSTSLRNNFSIGLSYTPWMHDNLSSNIDLFYGIAHKKLNHNQSVATSFRYFSLGDMTYMNDMGQVLKNHHSNEWAVDVSYIHLLGKYFSGALTFRYIHSDLYGDVTVNGIKTKVGKSYAADLAFFYFKKMEQGMNNKAFSTGLYISNIGSKISDIEGMDKRFLPATLRLGASYSMEAGTRNSLTFNLEARKFLIPMINSDSTYYPFYEDTNKSVFEGVFSSFTDAPGGFRDELKEVILSGGLEYAFIQNYFLRAGYSNIGNYKWERNFLTTGIGANFILNKKLLTIDAAYIVATRKSFPLAKANISISLTI